MNIVGTKSSMPIVKYVAWVLGILMNGIFIVLTKMTIPNVGLAIIIFTIIMYALMTPMQIKQQKFSKLNAVMSPEIQAIQKKYKGKKDQTSMAKMQEETQAVYNKYGVSPMGNCLFLVIQMPVLFALYQVIYKIPGYITEIGSTLGSFITSNKLIADGAVTAKVVDFFSDISNSGITESSTQPQLVDALYKLTPDQWSSFTKLYPAAESVHKSVNGWTSFLGLNISDTPMGILQGAWADKAWILIIAAILIPVLAWATQVLNYKLMPQPQTQQSDGADTMQNTMKSMNMIMPLMSAVFCLTLPVGMGIYWIAGALVRSIQAVFINRHLANTDINDLIQKNVDKMNKKREKRGLPAQKITQQAKMNVRNIESQQARSKEDLENEAKANEEKVKKTTELYNKNAKPGSIASKANMVSKYDELHGKSKKK